MNGGIGRSGGGGGGREADKTWRRYLYSRRLHQIVASPHREKEPPGVGFEFRVNKKKKKNSPASSYLNVCRAKPRRSVTNISFVRHMFLRRGPSKSCSINFTNLAPPPPSPPHRPLPLDLCHFFSSNSSNLTELETSLQPITGRQNQKPASSPSLSARDRAASSNLRHVSRGCRAVKRSGTLFKSGGDMAVTVFCQQSIIFLQEF